MISATTEGGYKIEIQKTFDDYIIIKHLGRGCCSVVFKVKSKFENHFYAAKIISKADMINRHYLDDINNEITIHKMLNHPNILQNYRTLELVNYKNEEFIIIIEDYCSEGNLLDYIQNNKFKDKDDRIYIEKQIIAAVKYLHKLGFAHTDISLKNILISKNSVVKLSDFGLCQFCQDDSSIYFKADIWSIGMILYSLYEGSQIKKTVYDKKGHLQTRIEDMKLRSLVDECTVMDLSKRPDIDRVESNEYFTTNNEEKEDELTVTLSDEKDESSYSKTYKDYLEMSISFGTLIDMKKRKNHKNDLRKSSKIKLEKKHSSKIKQRIQNESENDDESYFVYNVKSQK